MTTKHRTSPSLASASLVCGVLLAAACSGEDDTGAGSLTVILESEDVIVEGLEPGEGAENIRDGWSVTFDKYVAAIGDIDVHLATDASVEAEARDVFVADLTEAPAAGLPLWTLDGLRVGRWEFNYATPLASAGAIRHDSVSQADYDEMVASGWTYFIDGVLTKSDGQSCPPAALANPGTVQSNGNSSGPNDCYAATSIRFTFGAPAETRFGPCEIDEVPGFAIAAGATQTVTTTLHGDHLFFNGFPEGDEGGIMRLAQWLADSDLNVDGVVTREELEAIAPAQLPELDARFQLGGSPITPLEDMYDYVIGQLKTQGHFQGEGECPLDGVAHEDE